MNEPSLLDYLKAKLNPWQKEKVEIPAVTETDSDSAAGSPQPASIKWNLFAFSGLPWRSLLALCMGLIGQRFLEPPVNSYLLPVGYYALAALMLGWAYWVGEWKLPIAAQQEEKEDPLTLRRNWFIAGMLFSAVAFITFNENLFNEVNVFFWLAGILCFSVALFLINWQETYIKLSQFIQQPSWNVSITRWGLIVLAAFLLVGFFRFYDLAGTPGEPFSDHAEKLLDVYNVTQGQTNIFFPRNTGREFIQMYWTALMAWVFGTGLSFISLKIGTTLIGFFALPFIYLLGRDLFNKRVGLLALLLAGMAYWLNVISRVGLRFPLYPAFTAPVLYFLLRGLRLQNRNDFIWAGLFLGLGLHGYSTFRIVPFVVAAAILIYIIHTRSVMARRQAVILFVIVALAALLVFLPLLRVAIEFPGDVFYRSLTRIAETERPLPGPAWQILAQNMWKSALMMNVDNGGIWVHSVAARPALDVVSAVLFAFGYFLLLLRYLQKRDWLDLFLLLAVPLLMLSSSLSLAFPEENPSLNRSGGAAIVVFLIAALALDGLYSAFRESASRFGKGIGWGLVALLLIWSGLQNYDLVFNQYKTQFRYSAWNSSEMGRVIAAFVAAGNPVEDAHVVPFPYWVDTRLVGVWAGYPTRDFAMWRDDLNTSLDDTGAKLFLVKDEDSETLSVLRAMYPQASYNLYQSQTPGKNFWMVFVPPLNIPVVP